MNEALRVQTDDEPTLETRRAMATRRMVLTPLSLANSIEERAEHILDAADSRALGLTERALLFAIGWEFHRWAEDLRGTMPALGAFR